MCASCRRIPEHRLEKKRRHIALEKNSRHGDENSCKPNTDGPVACHLHVLNFAPKRNSDDHRSDETFSRPKQHENVNGLHFDAFSALVIPTQVCPEPSWPTRDRGRLVGNHTDETLVVISTPVLLHSEEPQKNSFAVHRVSTGGDGTQTPQSWNKDTH